MQTPVEVNNTWLKWLEQFVNFYIEFNHLITFRSYLVEMLLWRGDDDCDFGGDDDGTVGWWCLQLWLCIIPHLYGNTWQLFP